MASENLVVDQRADQETTRNDPLLKTLLSYLSKCEYGVDLKSLNYLILDSLYPDSKSVNDKTQEQIRNLLKETFSLGEEDAIDFVNQSISLCGNDVRPLDVMRRQAALIAKSSNHYIQVSQHSPNVIRRFRFDKDGSAPEGSFVGFQNSSMSENMEIVRISAGMLNQDRTRNGRAIEVLNHAIGRLFENSYQPYRMTLNRATYALLDGLGFKISEDEAIDYVLRAKVIQQTVSTEANGRARLAQIDGIQKHPEVFGTGTYKTVINDIISASNEKKSTFRQWCPERDSLDRLIDDAKKLRDK